MPTKKVYFPENETQRPELSIFMNQDKNLFVCISEFETHSTDLMIELPPSDAKEIIT